MAHEQVDITTTDGICPTHVFTPAGEGPWPAVIMYMDALGIRPGMLETGQHLADAGFVVLLPDLFYRYGTYEPMDPVAVIGGGNMRAVIMPFMSTTDTKKVAADTAHYIAYLDTRSDVKGDKIGVTGYCMGGSMAIAAAGAFPDRIAAAAPFHAGNLATDADTSPHLFVPSIEAEVYVGYADPDNSYPPEMAERFKKALDDAGVTYRHEGYKAAHGWMMPDFPIYDAGEAARGWQETIALFKRTLG